jgi:hypothetical protein
MWLHHDELRLTETGPSFEQGKRLHPLKGDTACTYLRELTGLAIVSHTVKVVFIIFISASELHVLHKPLIASAVAVRLCLLMLLQQRWSTAPAILDWAC